MLVFGRTYNQTVVITLPDDRRITITVKPIDKTKCRIGIVAPEDVVVNRGEIQEHVDLNKGSGILRPKYPTT